MSADPAPHKQFPQTSWTILSAVRGQGPDAQAALDEFSRRYYRPIHAYLNAIIRDVDEADDLSQGFFTSVILSGRLWARYDRARGSFRPYLKQALRNFVASEMRARQRSKRRPAEAELRPDQWSDGWNQLQVGDQGTPAPDAAFHQEWVRALLEEALARVRQICEAKDQAVHLALFVGRYLGEAPAPPGWDELGKPFKLDGKTARSRAETVASHFRVALRELLISEVGSVESADEEIATLLMLL